MLKYTLGGLLAFAILATTGLVILAKVDDSDADVEPARVIDIVIPPGALDKAPFDVERGRILEFRLFNQRETRMALSIQGEGVEQLPELAPVHETGSRESLPYVLIEVSPGTSQSALVRFNEVGEYEAKVTVPGVFLTTELIKITVK